VVALQDAQNAVLNPKLTVGDVAEAGDRYGRGGSACDLRQRHGQLPARRQPDRPAPAEMAAMCWAWRRTRYGLEGNGTRANGISQEGMEYSQDGAPMTNRNFGGEANSAQATLPDPWTSLSRFRVKITVGRRGDCALRISALELGSCNRIRIGQAWPAPNWLRRRSCDWSSRAILGIFHSLLHDPLARVPFPSSPGTVFCARPTHCGHSAGAGRSGWRRAGSLTVPLS